MPDDTAGAGMAVVPVPDSAAVQGRAAQTAAFFSQDPASIDWRTMTEIVEEGEDFIRAAIGEEGFEDIERRTAIFNEIAKDFDCSVGKVPLHSLLDHCSALAMRRRSCFSRGWLARANARPPSPTVLMIILALLFSNRRRVGGNATNEASRRLT